jgi:peptidoglycan/xylan/chitin deacetylase (PgdA/CDA1 family)
MRQSIPFILCSFMILSCSTTPKSPYLDRIPTSITEESLKVSFDILMSSENPEKEFISYLNRLRSIYIRGEAYLADFDTEIDLAISQSSKIELDKSSTYKKLLVMRELTIKMQDKITYFYVLLNEIAYDKSKSILEKNLAKKILKDFKAQLDSPNAIEKLAYEDLRKHIANALKLRRGKLKSLNQEIEISSEVFKKDEDRANLIRNNRIAIIQLGKLESQRNIEFTKTIENESEKIQLQDLPQTRNPQSEKVFFPSIGPNGNVVGMVFPKGVWALTYDDGPSPVYTPSVVKNLDELGINATFFWLAQNVIQYQSVVDLVKSNNKALANHSWSHAQLPKVSEEQLKKEINLSTEVETKAYGQPIEFFRCPYGAGNSIPRIRQKIADLGMIHVFWNVDTLDWQDKDPDSIVERAKKEMKLNGHGVVLFHDVHPQSVIASKKLVEWSKTLDGTPDQMRWVTIPGIVHEMNKD